MKFGFILQTSEMYLAMTVKPFTAVAWKHQKTTLYL